MPALVPSTAQVSAANAALLKVLSALTPAALPHLTRALEAAAKYPMLLKVIWRAAEMASKSRRPYDPRVLARAITAAASELANEKLTDEYLRALPVRGRRK